MKIAAASQYLSAVEQHTTQRSRLTLGQSDVNTSLNARGSSQLNNNSAAQAGAWQPSSTPATSQAAPQPLGLTVSRPSPTVLLAPDLMPSIPELNPASTETRTETSAEQGPDEDSQPFNALLTIGAVKRILEQLSSGKLLSSIEGNNFEKIAAQQAMAPSAPSRTNAVENEQQTGTQNSSGNTILEFSYRYQSVAANFTGEANLVDGGTVSWSFDLSMQSTEMSMSIRQEAPLKDPLVLSLDNKPFAWTGETTDFDFFNDGTTRQLATLNHSQFYLAWDRNQNDRIDSGAELFGPQTNQGFQELAKLDNDLNGFIDEQDARWQQLRLWQPGETPKTLAEYGIGAISTQSVATTFGYYQQDTLQAQIARSGMYLTENGQAGLMQQVNLNV